MHFSCCDVDDGLGSAQEWYSQDDGWSILIFPHVDDKEVSLDEMVINLDGDILQQSFHESKYLVCHLQVHISRFQGHSTIQIFISFLGHYVHARSGVTDNFLKGASIDGAFNGWDTWVIFLDQVRGLELMIMLPTLIIVTDPACCGFLFHCCSCSSVCSSLVHRDVVDVHGNVAFSY